MPAHKKFSDAQRDRCAEVARLREITPTDKELARELGIADVSVKMLMGAYRLKCTKKTGSSWSRTATPDEVADAIIQEYGLK